MTADKMKANAKAGPEPAQPAPVGQQAQRTAPARRPVLHLKNPPPKLKLDVDQTPIKHAAHLSDEDSN